MAISYQWGKMKKSEALKIIDEVYGEFVQDWLKADINNLEGITPLNERILNALEKAGMLPPFTYLKKLGTLIQHGSRRMNNFSTGERVKAFGNLGTIKSLSSNGMFLEVKFDNVDQTVVFLIDGRIFSWNKKPSLKKVITRKK